MKRRIWGLTAGFLLAVLLVGSGAHATTFGANPGGEGAAGRMVSVSQTFRVLTGNNSSLKVLRSCSAVATPLPAATVIHCYLKGRTDGKIYANTTHAMSGPVSTINQVMTLPVQPYTMCVRGWALYGDGTYLFSPATGDLCQ
jgi:hypothetical protein